MAFTLSANAFFLLYLISDLNVEDLFLPSLPAPSGAVREVVICATQGHLRGFRDKVFKMILPPVRKISQKLRTTLAYKPGCRTSRRKPRSVGLEKEL